ncbi:PAS domain S-box-containing protein [Reichenbachiella faecimaris]|uniref:histidine kinase n=1 Tax=Reichenbachiella faecimaris TaxID=692418 RepID=A0A1W2G932_REIFA|nr:PAS domain S-box protein [Reichenbachiella faecimaris]SMD33101.1 PAS domain S-box-containing protein [Reichenbachiella faecimaris]
MSSTQIQEERYLDIINQFAVGLLNQSTIKETLWSVIDNVVSKLDFYDCAIYLLDEDKEHLIQVASQAYKDKEPRNTNATFIKMGTGIVGKVAQEKQSRITNDTSQSEDYITDDQWRFSEITVPIIHENELIGIIDSEHPEKDFFQPIHLNILTTIASMVAIKVVQARHLENLAAREKSFDLIYSSTNDLIFLMEVEPNDSFRCVSVNRAFLELTNKKRGDVVGKTIDDIWDAERSATIKSYYREAIETKKPITYQIKFRTGNNIVIVETKVTPVFDHRGRCTNLSGISRDITTAEAVRSELGYEREKYQTLFSKANDAIFILKDDLIIECNDRTTEIFGRDREGLIGYAPHELSPQVQPDGKTSDRRMDQDNFQWVHTKKDGSYFTADVTLSRYHFKNEEYTQAIVRDVSERIKAEEVLRASEKRYRTIFENSLDGIYKSTPEGRFVEVSPALVAMLGYDSEEELLSINIKKDLYFKEEDRFKHSNQYRLKKKNGDEIWVEDHGFYQYDGEGKVIFHQGILRDVTAKNQKQMELENLLNMTSDQNKRLQNFAHIVSHNIRSHSANLTSLVSFMEMTKDEAEKQKMFQMLKSSTGQLEETIMNLNEIITVNQNLNKPIEQRNLMEEVEKTLQILNDEILESGVKIAVDIPEDLVLPIIPAYLDSILLNLLSNAIKYRRSEVKSEIKIQAKAIQGKVQIEISDNGMGIDMDAHGDKIFGMYKTFHQNEDARGFGLYITKNQIETMKGKILVDSKVNRGTTFTVYFNEER